MKKITVYIITYNQEDTIRRALDSVLKQKDWGLYCMVVSDDCSEDKTWSILQEYQFKYPKIIKAYRNERNLGIYDNLARAESYLPQDSDLYGSLSGDDEFCDGYFKGVQELIERECVDTSESIGIFSDWKSIDSFGKEVVHKQIAAVSGYRLWSLKARGYISSRSLLVTKKVRDGYENILNGYALNLTESHFDAQPLLNIKIPYYFPQVTSIYYSGIGVSTRLSLDKSDYLTRQNIEKWEYGIKHYINDEYDLSYAKYEILKSEYYLQPSFFKLPDILHYYVKGQLPHYRFSLMSLFRLCASLLKYGVVKRLFTPNHKEN